MLFLIENNSANNVLIFNKKQTQNTEIENHICKYITYFKIKAMTNIKNKTSEEEVRAKLRTEYSLKLDWFSWLKIGKVTHISLVRSTQQ